jgi:asparagine synthase (glutamine-hydrolysing)
LCGISGFLDLSSSSYDREEALRRMTDRLAHRGPDSAGLWQDAAAGIALGHRRLSIVDLSPNGHQPMVCSTGRFVLVYNGEIYNAEDMRAALKQKGVTFRGHSDSEILLEACRLWGVKEAIQRSNGMFAFALWDRETRTLYLARDRLGIKPLYWAQFNQLFIFGSELKALRAHPLWQEETDPDALKSYLQLSYIPAPLSIYKNVYKLLPGHILTLHPDGQRTDEMYWDFQSIVHRPQHPQSEEEAIERLDSLLPPFCREALTVPSSPPSCRIKAVRRLKLSPLVLASMITMRRPMPPLLRVILEPTTMSFP